MMYSDDNKANKIKKTKKTKKSKKTAIIVMAVLIVIIWLVGYIDINTRFPKAESETYNMNEWVDNGNINIRVNSAQYMDQEKVYDLYGIEPIKDTSTHYFILSIDVLNRSDNEINLAKEFYGNIAMDIYPLGYHNIGERVHREDNNVKKMLKKDEQQEVIFAFIISDGSIREDRRWMMHKSQIYMTLSNYPIHKMIMLDNIEGF